MSSRTVRKARQGRALALARVEEALGKIEINEEALVKALVKAEEVQAKRLAKQRALDKIHAANRQLRQAYKNEAGAEALGELLKNFYAAVKDGLAVGVAHHGTDEDKSMRKDLLGVKERRKKRQ